MALHSRQPGASDGFTIVEVMVASMLLVVGILGVLSLLTGALRTTGTNAERVGATNLARELVETTRGLDYDDMTGARTQAALQQRGLGSGTPWTIERRGVAYTITATSCTYDDPADGLATPAPDGVCLPQPAGATGDVNGDDFRRTTFTLQWRRSGGALRIQQTTLIGNPSGGLGPRIVSFTPVSQTITSNVSTATVTWTTTAAQSLRWSVDDGRSSGSSSGSTSFTTAWNIGSSGSGAADEVLDGAYQISAQPFDDRDIAGEVKRANVVLNRRQPYAPLAFAGGHDTRLATLVDIITQTWLGGWVDLQWSPNSERDILGYRVMWAGFDGLVGHGDDAQACPDPLLASMLGRQTTTCVVLAAPIFATNYYVVALDRAPDNTVREGDPQLLAIGAPGARPAAPTGLSVQTINDEPKLSWGPPASGTASFYRIYRDGVGVGYLDRYDRTNAVTFTDSSPQGVGHRYWVTAVNSVFNESDTVGPVDWSP